MIEYVIAESPDDRILAKASQILKDGGLVCYPTDTNWLVVCDPFVKKGLENEVKIIKVDVDKNPQAAQKFQVRGVPTMLLFKEGKQLGKGALLFY